MYGWWISPNGLLCYYDREQLGHVPVNETWNKRNGGYRVIVCATTTKPNEDKSGRIHVNETWHKRNGGFRRILCAITIKADEDKIGLYTCERNLAILMVDVSDIT